MLVFITALFFVGVLFTIVGKMMGSGQLAKQSIKAASDAEKYPLLEKYKPAARRQAERLNSGPRLKRNTVYRLCTRCDGFVEPRGGSAGHDGYVNPVGMATKVAGGVVLTAIPVAGWVMGPLAILGAGKKSGAVGPSPPHGVCLKCGGKYDSANFAVLKQHALAR
jgi:hypothetical protein